MAPTDMHASISKLAYNSVTLKCAADGTPLPEITWLKNGKLFERRQVGTVSEHCMVGDFKLQKNI